MAKNLIYTLAIDEPRRTAHRNMAKLLVSSLLRTRFSGEILVFRNTPEPLHMVPRAGVREVQVQLSEAEISKRGFAEAVFALKHGVASAIESSDFEKIMYLDCDCVALRNIDTLLKGDWDVKVMREPDMPITSAPFNRYLTPEEIESLPGEGVNSGAWAASGRIFPKLMKAWQTAQALPPTLGNSYRDQSAFNRVLLDWTGPIAEWPRGEIVMPLVHARHRHHFETLRATLVHAAAGCPLDDKLRFLFSTFAGRFLFDPQLLLFHTMEM